jgi:hypothetical protein
MHGRASWTEGGLKEGVQARGGGAWGEAIWAIFGVDKWLEALETLNFRCKASGVAREDSLAPLLHDGLQGTLDAWAGAFAAGITWPVS